MSEGYIRPLVYLGAGAMGLLPKDNPTQLAIIVWPWGAYLGDEGLERGIRAKVSSYTRHHPNVSLTKSKTCGDYVNSILAKREVTRHGLRRGDHARHQRAGRGVQRREHLHRAPRRC